MVRLTGGEALVKQLRAEGVRVVFGLPGVQLYGVWAALRDEPDIDVITTRHEQATSYMADGYARAGGGFGTALVVPGPGLLNASAGLSTAYSASSPVLMIAGQIPGDQIGKRVGLLHEVDDQLDAIAPVTKWRKRILSTRDIPAAVHEAVRQLKTGRPRPVQIEIPPDALEVEAEVEMLDPANPVRPGAPSAEIDRAAAKLTHAGTVAIYAGGGVHLSGAHQALARLASLLQAGVVQSPEGKGAIDDRSYLSLGGAIYPGTPARGYVDSADVVLVVGSRLAMADLKPDQDVIQIDIDGDEIGRNHGNTFALEGDAKATLEGIADRIGAGVTPPPSRRGRFQALRSASAELAMQATPQGPILRSLREGCPDDTLLVSGMTQLGYYSRPFWDVYEPRTYITSSYSGNLGFAYPTGLGAKVACPERPVVIVSGDGGFLYNSGELATAVQHRINAVLVLFNDNAYGNVARDLDINWGGSYGADLRNPDFMKLADAYGLAGLRVEDPATVGRSVREAIELDAPALVEVPVGRMPRPVFFSPRRTLPKYARQAIAPPLRRRRGRC